MDGKHEVGLDVQNVWRLDEFKKQGPHEIARRASTDVPLLTRVGFLSGLGTGKDGRVDSIQ
jgi:hypothetical protein